MSHPGRHIALLAFLWLVLTQSALALEPAQGVLPADEFCAPPKASVRCPKTSASVCACSLASRSSQAEAPPEAAQPSVTTVRLVRIKPVLRALPKTEWRMVCLTFVDSIPTPPPRI